MILPIRATGKLDAIFLKFQKRFLISVSLGTNSGEHLFPVFAIGRQIAFRNSWISRLWGNIEMLPSSIAVFLFPITEDTVSKILEHIEEFTVNDLDAIDFAIGNSELGWCHYSIDIIHRRIGMLSHEEFIS
jgi:hypothetical protein